MLSSKIKLQHLLVPISILVMALVNAAPAAAQQATPPSLPGWTMGTGTHFELPTSPYLPVTLDSSVSVTLRLGSVPEIVDVMIDADVATASANFTFGGFTANTLYYQYADNGLDPITFTTDATGSFTITQDLSAPHNVWFRSQPSTFYLYDNATGGDCSASMGTWSSATKTCTLTHNITTAIFIQNNGITLDGAGYQVSSPGNYAVYSAGFSNVTIKNVTAISAYGIWAIQGSNLTVTNNTITSTNYGIVMYFDNNVSMTNNTVNAPIYGLYSDTNTGNVTIDQNTVSATAGADYGIFQYNGSGVIAVTHNTVSDYPYGGLSVYALANHPVSVFNNNFINNTLQIQASGSSSFNQVAPVGGNYFSNFHTLVQGCNDSNSDGFCDAPYHFNGGQDNLPWTTQQNSWAAGAPADSTPPVITYALTPATPDGANGWYKSNVTLVWSVTDPESTVTKTGCVDQNITADQAATAYACSATSAGGASGPVSVSIKRDATPPTNVSGAAARLPDHNGWYNNPVGVTFSGHDATSGIASCTSATFSGPDNAAASAAGSCTDNAGNNANGSFALQYDSSAPSAALSVIAGTAGANGWYVSDVTIHTSGSDAVSGIESCTLDQSQTAETAGTPLNGSCTNGAGLTTNATPLTIKLDKTTPTASLSAVGTLGNNGWYVSNVTIKTTGSDSISNPTICTADQLQTTDTPGAAFNGSCTNNAGLTTNAAPLTVKVDQTKPTLNPVVSPNPVLLNGVATVTSGAADALSGLASQSCGALVTNSIGQKSVTCAATDNAGNTNSATVNYNVIYRFDGFLQPINDTAHTLICGSPCPASIFKGGSTVPVKFQLKDANGVVVQSTSLPLWLTPVKGSATTAVVDETPYSDPATSGTTYRWDGTSQYIYNWSSKGFTIGYFWRIGVTLDDGQTYYVSIGLK